MSEPPIKRVSAEVLRKLFNDSGYLEQYQNGQLQSTLRKSKHPSAPRAKEPFCTQSQYITYVNKDGDKIAGAINTYALMAHLVHQGVLIQRKYSLMEYCIYLRQQ
jgi:hypothetical protein